MGRPRKATKKNQLNKIKNTKVKGRPKNKVASTSKPDPIRKHESDTDDDVDFELTAEMMVHDFDDETTLWQEETLSDGEYVDELALLEKDNELTIDQLREKYTRLQKEYEDDHKLTGNKSKKYTDSAEIEDDDEYVPKKSYYQSDKNSGKIPQISNDGKDLPPRSKRIASRQLPKYVYGSDYDYSSDEDDDREVKIGEDHQAYVPNIHYTFDIYPPNPFPVHPRHLIWTSFVTTPENVENYFNELNKYINYTSQPSEDYALAHFYKYGCNIEIAIKNLDELVSTIDQSFLNWSSTDCDLFEKGVLEFGKDFVSIQQKYLKFKPYVEVVRFYYIWKKSERADQFVVKLKEKSKTKRFISSIFDYLDNVMSDKKLPYKLSEDGIHYELDDVE